MEANPELAGAIDPGSAQPDIKQLRAWPLALTALALGGLGDLLLFHPGPGLGTSLFLLLLPAAFGGLLRIHGLRPHGPSLWPLLGAYGFFATMLSVRASAFVTALNGLACLLLLGLLACLALPGHLLEVRFAAIFSAPCRLLAASLYRAAPIVASTLDSALGYLKNADERSSIWPLLRGLLFSIPVLLILVPLLASADSVFADHLLLLGRWFNPEQIFDTIWRLNRAGFVTWITLGGLTFALTVRPFAPKSQSEDARPLGFIEAMTVLSSVALVFGSFLSIQITYLFGGSARVLSVPGMTFAEYARRGFAELVLVSLLTLILILGLSALTRRTGQQTIGFSALASAIVAETLVLLCSACSRMATYEAAYGATQTRIQVDVFILWLGVALLWLVLTLWSRPWAPRFAIGGLICGLGYVASLNLLNPDALVAKRNIQRWQDTGNLDVNALCGLSHDAKNSLAPLAYKLQDRDSRQAINTWIESHNKPIKTWQSWHWAKRN
jgi:hypothetical protein